MALGAVGGDFVHRLARHAARVEHAGVLVHAQLLGGKDFDVHGLPAPQDAQTGSTAIVSCWQRVAGGVTRPGYSLHEGFTEEKDMFGEHGGGLRLGDGQGAPRPGHHTVPVDVHGDGVTRLQIREHLPPLLQLRPRKQVEDGLNHAKRRRGRGRDAGVGAKHRRKHTPHDPHAPRPTYTSLTQLRSVRPRSSSISCSFTPTPALKSPTTAVVCSNSCTRHANVGR